MKMTIKQRIWTFLASCRGAPQTAAVIHRATISDGHGQSIMLSSLSSELNKMSNEGTITRVPETGPRGGNGYMLEKDIR